MVDCVNIDCWFYNRIGHLYINTIVHEFTFNSVINFFITEVTLCTSALNMTFLSYCICMHESLDTLCC